MSAQEGTKVNEHLTDSSTSVDTFSDRCDRVRRSLGTPRPTGPESSSILINDDELIRKGAPGGRNPNGTFAPGNRDSWKHGAYSRQTRRTLVEGREVAAALADHCQEIETDLG